MKFSIIVPVYNVKKYIEKCVQSVLTQTITDYELILVDDGASDGSEILCDCYAQKHANIKVIHKTNAGLSSARNAGLKIASGNYIIYLDGDDFWIENTLLQEINVRIERENVDLVAFGGKEYYCENDGDKFKQLKVVFDKECVITTEEYIKSSLKKNELYPWYAWLYAIRRDILVNHKFEFPEGRYYEDVYAVWRMLNLTRSVSVIPMEAYAYRQQRIGAITNSTSYQKLCDFLWANETNIQDILKMDMDEDVRKLLLDSFSKNYYSCCISQGELSGEEKKEYYRELKKKRYLMDYALSRKWVIIRRVSKIIGFRGMLLVFHLRAKWRKRNG